MKKTIVIEITKLDNGYIIQTQKKTLIFYHQTKKYAVETFESMQFKVEYFLKQFNETK